MLVGPVLVGDHSAEELLVQHLLDFDLLELDVLVERPFGAPVQGCDLLKLFADLELFGLDLL